MMYFDGHSDLLYDVTRRRLAGESHVLERQKHLEHLRQGGVEGLALALWTSTAGGHTFWEHTPWNTPKAHRDRTRQMLACAQDEFQDCKDDLCLVHTVEEAEAAKKHQKIYAFLSVEGMAAVGNDVSGVDWYYQNGVRMGMLTWNEENQLATGAGGDPQKGLTVLGKQVIRRMQELHMAVDVSHLNDGGFWDVIQSTNAPVIASHSNCRALCDARRNLSDEQLRAIRDTGGIVGLNAYREFIHPDFQEQTAKTLALHAVHMAEVMGIEHVACGFDFCGFMGPGNESADNLEHAGQIPNLFDWLTRFGMTSNEQNAIAHENFLRVLKQIFDS